MAKEKLLQYEREAIESFKHMKLNENKKKTRYFNGKKYYASYENLPTKKEIIEKKKKWKKLNHNAIIDKDKDGYFIWHRKKFPSYKKRKENITNILKNKNEYGSGYFLVKKVEGKYVLLKKKDFSHKKKEYGRYKNLNGVVNAIIKYEDDVNLEYSNL